jgi:hypothetical protein
MVFPAATVLFIAKFGSPTPVTDEWLLVENVRQVWEQGVSPFDIRTYVNAHPIHSPAFFYLLTAPLVRFDSRVFMFLQVLLLGAVFFSFLRVCHWPKRHAHWLRALLAAIVFSPVQYHNLLWGFMFSGGASIGLGVLGLWILVRLCEATNDRIALGRSLFASSSFFLAATSTAAGTFVFPAALLLLALLRLPARRRRIGFLCVTASLAAWMVLLGSQAEFAFQFERRTRGVPLLLFIKNLLNNTYFIPSAIGTLLPTGSATATQYLVGLPLSVLALVSAFLCWRRRREPAYVFFLANILLSFAAIATAAATRRVFATYYVVFVLPAVCATLCSLAQERPGAARETAGLIAAALCSIPLFLGYYHAWSIAAPSYSSYVASIEAYMLDFASGRPRRPQPYPDPGYQPLTPQIVCFLERRGHPLFAADPDVSVACLRVRR